MGVTEKMRKILVVITTAFVPWGGLTTVAMNYYRAMDKRDLQIDFASDSETVPALAGELEENGSRYIQLPDRKRHPVKYAGSLFRVLRSGRYGLIHVHGNSATMLTELIPAWILRVRKRIVHVHTTQSSHLVTHTIMKLPMNMLATERIAVSKAAGCYLYGKRKFILLNNAIDVNRYRYNAEYRKEYRKRLGLSEKEYVLGTVGKLHASKNTLFLVDVFYKIWLKCRTAKLLIVGDGELRTEIEKRIAQLGIESHCMLVGMQMDTSPFLSVMDVFVFPSQYEGLGLALVEAQAAGLPCYASDRVPQEAAVTESVEFMALEQGAEEWAALIYERGICGDRTAASQYAEKQICRSGYHILTEAERLRKIYSEKQKGK